MSAITIRIYKINPETGQRHDVRETRHTGMPTTRTFTRRWPDCACPQHREQT